MSTVNFPASGSEVSLTGDQVKYIRLRLDDTQEQFAERFAVSHMVIGRLERSKDEAHSGPLVILMKLLAEHSGFDVPEIPFPRKRAADATAEADAV